MENPSGLGKDLILMNIIKAGFINSREIYNEFFITLVRFGLIKSIAIGMDNASLKLFGFKGIAFSGFLCLWLYLFSE